MILSNWRMTLAITLPSLPARTKPDHLPVVFRTSLSQACPDVDQDAAIRGSDVGNYESIGNVLV